LGQARLVVLAPYKRSAYLYGPVCAADRPLIQVRPLDKRAPPEKDALMTDDLLDRLTVRQLVEDWAVLRDARMWGRFREVWHDDGRMMATWFQGSRDEFIKVSEEGYARGVRILHFLGGSTSMSPAIAPSPDQMTISQRARVDDVLCDVVCTGRFYDFFEKRAGRWGPGAAQPIYEKGSARSARPVGEARARQNLLGAFPEGYRHPRLSANAHRYTVKPDMPGLDGPRSRRFNARGRGGSRAARFSQTLRDHASLRNPAPAPTARCRSGSVAACPCNSAA